MKFKVVLLLVLIFLFTGFAFAAEDNLASTQPQFVLTSPVFKDGQMMPSSYRYYSGNKSPVLQWANVPEGTNSFSVTCIDYDAPANGYVHWEIKNIPATYVELPVGIPSEKNWKDGIVQSTPWIGPYPPNGVHRYHFVIEAKDAKGKTIKKAELIGRSD